jgi:hypothetical protein
MYKDLCCVVFLKEMKDMKMGLTRSLLAGAALALAGSGASLSSAAAGTVWSEDWNPANFTISGTVTDSPVGDLTDLTGWLNVSYNVFSSTLPSAQHGWTFSGSDFLIINTTSGSPQGALYLNECCNPGVTGGGGATASTTITGLTAGKDYQLSFLYWGDNRPNNGSPAYPSYPGYYDLLLTLGGGAQMTYPGDDQYPGTSSGHLVDLSFIATGPTESLSLAQFSSGNSQQSPIIGAITVSVPEPSTWAMLILGFAGLGFAGYRKARDPRAIAV